MAVSPFYWNSASDNSLYKDSREQGHIELEADLPSGTFSATSGLYDRDPKVSGTVKIQGTANDNKILREIKVKIPGILDGYTTVGTYTTGSGWNDTKSDEIDTVLAGSAWAFTVDSEEITQANGHTVNWTLTVDTAKIKDVAALDVAVQVMATDQSDNSSAESDTQTEKGAETGYYRMDVVPYITKLYTNISDTAGEEFARSATGKYIVYEGETVKMYGFNLKEGTDNAKIGDTSVTTTKGDGTYINLPVGTTAVSGKVSVTVNSITSLNNINANPAFKSGTDDTITATEYNSQANGITNNRLTDDVELYIWGMDYFLKRTDITSPMMKMDASGNYYMSYGDGNVDFSMNKNGTSTKLETCFNKYHNTNVAFDSDGNWYGVATNTDRVGTSKYYATSYTFFSREPGVVTDSENLYPGSSFVNQTYGHYSFGTNKRRLELSQYGGDSGTYNISRVQRPKITVSGDTSEAKVYMAYYDSSASDKPVKFRYGTVTGTEKTSGRNYSRVSKMTGGIENDLTGNGVDTGSASDCHIIADSNTNFKGGAYTAVGCTPEGYAVVAWYDASTRKICYSYNTAPDSAVSGGVWQTNAKYLDGAYTGWYVDLCVDAGGGIHIAYYNSAKGDLKYVYLSKYDAEPTSPVTIDSYLSVGTNITVNTRKETVDSKDVYVPYIYYYNASSNQTPNSIKVAWQKDFASLRDGAISDKFTGAWESMTIPATNIPVDATVCGGVPTGGSYADKIVLGYMSDTGYEKAVLK